MRILATALILVVSIGSATAQTLTVTTEKDTVDAADGVLSLREAVDSANVTAGVQDIRFSASVFPAGPPNTIFLKSSLYLTDASGVTIRGDNAAVELRADTNNTDRYEAINLKQGNSTIANLAIRDFRGAGIRIDTVSTAVMVYGNKLTNCENGGVTVFRSNEIVIRKNVVTLAGWWGGEEGIMVADTSETVTIDSNQVTTNYSSGIGIYYSANVLISHNYISRNMYNGISIGGYGVNTNNNDFAFIIEENIIAGNAYDGVSAYNSSQIGVWKNSIGDSTATYLVPTQALSTESFDSPIRPARVLERPLLVLEEQIRAKSDEARAQRTTPPRRSNPAYRERPPRQVAAHVASAASPASLMTHNGNGGSGVGLYGVTMSVIEDNLIYGSGSDGIYISGGYDQTESYVYSDVITINRNRIERSYDSQVEFYSVGALTITNNTMLFSQYGIYGGGYGGGLLVETYSVRSTAVVIPLVTVSILENYLTQGDDGEVVYVYDADYVQIDRNIISNYYDGIYLYNVRKAEVRMNDFSNVDSYAVDAYVTDSLHVADNRIQNCYEGIYADGPYENVNSYVEILRNNLTSVTYDCLDVYGFQKGLVQWNKVQNTYYEGIDAGYMGQLVVADNSVVNTNYYGLYAYSIDSLSVTRNKFEAQIDDYGMYVYSIGRAYVDHNTVTDGYDGSYFYDIDSLWAWNNSFLSSRSDGFYLEYSFVAHVWENDFYGHQGDGMYVYDVDSLLFEKNNVSGNAYDGFSMYYTTKSTLRNNTILENGDAGISSYYDTSFVIENNFIALNEYGFSIYYTDVNSRVNNNTFFRNQQGSYYSGSIQSINAENNYWGHASGPHDENDYDGLGLLNSGSGDDVSEAIDWDPFLTTPPYLSEAKPTIVAVNPGQSPRAGGQIAALRGRQFLPGVILVLGKDTVKTTQYVSSDLLSFTVPSGRGGPVNVIVYNINGKADTLAKGFVYDNNTPFAFSLVSPAANSTIATANPLFVWRRSTDPDGDAVEYILHYSSSPTFENPTTVLAIPDTSYLPGPNALTANTTYYWRVVASDTREGYISSPASTFKTGLVLSVEPGQQLPVSFGLRQNYPNPFNPETSIRFEIPEAATVTLRIFDILGREVATLLHDDKPAGFYTAVWNGRNSAGQQVSSGIYFYRIEAGNFVETKRMLLVR